MYATTTETCDPVKLLALVHAGDLAALDHMTACFGDRLIAVGRRYCRNREDAEDVVQDALLSAARGLHTYRGEGPIEGWLVRMVANACHRLRRGRKNDPALHAVDVELPTDDTEDPEILAGRGELAVAIGAALDALSPTDRLIVILAEGQDWTGPEIAAELGISAGAVRSRLSRARSKVRTLLTTSLA